MISVEWTGAEIEPPRKKRGPVPLPAGHPHWAEKYAHIADARRDGLSLQQIGEHYGITRERVRQCLVLIGDESLIGERSPFVRARKAESEAGHWMTCRTCGKRYRHEYGRGHRDRSPVCSEACKWLTPRRNGKAAEIMRVKLAGGTWNEAAEAVGLFNKGAGHGPSAQNWLRKWSTKTGMDISHVLGLYGGGHERTTFRNPSEAA